MGMSFRENIIKALGGSVKPPAKCLICGEIVRSDTGIKFKECGRDFIMCIHPNCFFNEILDIKRLRKNQETINEKKNEM